MNLTKALIGATLLSVASAMPSWAQGIPVSAESPAVTETFNSMADGLILPAGWRVERNLTAPRNVGSFASASQSVMYQGGTSLASHASNGTWNFGNSADASDRAIGGLTTTVANGTRCINLMTAITNSHSDGFTLTGLDVAYAIEKYRNCANASGFAVQLYTSTDGLTWTSAGSDFCTFFDKTADTATGADVVPITTDNVSASLSGLNVKAGETLYLAWNISVAAGTTPDKSPGLAIDDIALTASFSEPLPEEPQPEIVLSQNYPIMREDFDGMINGDTPSLSLPDCWRVDRRLHADGDDVWMRPYSTASSEVMYTGGVSLASNAKNGSYNFGPSDTSTDRAVGGISTGSGTNGGQSTKCINVMTVLTNIDPMPVTHFKISYDIEKYRNGNNSNGFDVQLYTSPDGIEWTSAGPDFLTHFAPDGATAGAADVPITTVQVADKYLITEVGPGEKIYLAWHIAVGNHVKEASGAQALAIDNVEVVAMYNVLESDIPSKIVLKPENVVLTPTLPEKVKVLSLNNSLIDYNDQNLMFNEIAEFMGSQATWTKHTILGQPLSVHFAETGENSARNIISSGYWSHIILQEQSALPRTDVETFRANVKAWVDFIRANCPNPNAVIILPMNWAYNADSWSHFAEDNLSLHNNYIDVATDLGVSVCPIGDAYDRVFNEMGAETTAKLYTDNRHPSPEASYMAACMEYALIYGIDPNLLAYTPSSVTDTRLAQDLRDVASETFRAFANLVDNAGGSVIFSAKAYDAYGRELTDIHPGIASNGGIINGYKYVADPNPGTYRVIAQYLPIESNEATVTVAYPIEPKPLTEDLTVHGYLNLLFKNYRYTSETDADKRYLALGAPYTVTLCTDGTVIYDLDYSIAADIAGAPRPQIWMNGFKSMVDEGNGHYSFTFPDKYSQGDEIQFSRYVAGVVDDNKKITLVANEPIEPGQPARVKLYLSANDVLFDEYVTASPAISDAEGRYLNINPEAEYTVTEPGAVNGVRIDTPFMGSYAVTVSLPEYGLTDTAKVVRHAPSGAANLAADATFTADDDAANLNYAHDNNIATQAVWTIGAKNEEHWLDVDLGSLCTIKSITLVWEGASATVYDLHLSKNGTDYVDSNIVTDGEYGDGRTIYKDFAQYADEPVNARYLHLRTHTVYNAGYGMKLKEVYVFGHELEPLVYTIDGIEFARQADGTFALNAAINHSGADEVAAYEVWVVDLSAPAAGKPRRAPEAGTADTDGNLVVGSATVIPDGSPVLPVEIPLTHLVADGTVHTLAVRAQATLTDGTTAYAADHSEGDAPGAAGNEAIALDTAPDVPTGILTVGTDSEVEYYNLQGVRISCPDKGIYIRRQGSRAVIVRR